MEKIHSNSNKTVSTTNTNQPFFQRKSENKQEEPFFKPKGSKNVFFPPSNKTTPIQRKKVVYLKNYN